MKVNYINSGTSSVTCGVSQESFIGPLPFLQLVYINYLHNNSLTVITSIIFADDCSAYASGPNIQKLAQDVNSDLDSLSEWFYLNKLSLDMEKSVYAIFTIRIIRKEINIILKGRIKSTTKRAGKSPRDYCRLEIVEHITRSIILNFDSLGMFVQHYKK